MEKKKKSFISKEKNEFITFFKDHITLILLSLYTLSFINYYLYYKSFEISIFNYVGLNDLLFFSLEYIFNIFLLIFVSEIILFIIFVFLHKMYEKFILFVVKKKGILYLHSNNRDKERINEVLQKTFNTSLNKFRMTIIILSLFVISQLSDKLILYPTILIYIAYYLEKFSKDIAPHLTLTSASIIITIFMIITTLVNSYNKRFEKDDYIISFNEEDAFITTDKKLSCINYLGETSSNIFLYDIKNKESKIYFKDKISNIKIKNSNTIDNYILIITNNFIVKSYMEMLNSKK
nr:hypothetical protein [uncultured Flavobacterium sp.]